MSRYVMYRAVPLFLLFATVVSCRILGPDSRHPPPELPDLTPTYLDYVDSEGFDALLETVLINQDPVIVIRTGRTRPDWNGRLNAWIAAWNRSNERPLGRKPRSRASEEALADPVIRGQSPLTRVPLDGDSIREFRLLVGGLLDRVEDLAHSSASWWVEERARSRRVALLQPYSLRFHLGEDEQILLIFFHGAYSTYYPRHLQLLMKTDSMKGLQWSRSVECSCYRKGYPHEIGKLTSSTGEE